MLQRHDKDAAEQAMRELTTNHSNVVELLSSGYHSSMCLMASACRTASLLLLLAAAGAAAASAQTVRGVVRDADTGQPIPGAFVVLHNTQSAVRSSVLTDPSGRFALLAHSPGTYSLTAQVIGYELPDSARLQLNAGEVRTIDLALRLSAIALPAIAVTGRRRCGERSRGDEIARVWEEARKALDVAAWMTEDTLITFSVRSFERYVTPDGRPLSDETMTFERLTGKQTYTAAPVDSLIAEGFVQRVDDRWSYFGPDAQLLLSNGFQEHHCFWVERRREYPGMVALGFEPAPGRRIPDIAGELWLDERSGELRFVDYGFVNLEFTTDRRSAGGRTEYKRLLNGGWIVQRWEIRMPHGQNMTGRRLNVDSVQIIGAEVLNARMAGSAGPATTGGGAQISGIVYDSVRGQPLPNARVFIVHTPLETITDSAGRFLFDRVPTGIQYATVAHARLDSIPAAPPYRRIEVDSQALAIILSTPNAARIRARLCNEEQLRNAARSTNRRLSALTVVRVVARDARSREPLNGVSVTATWQDPIRGGAISRSATGTTNEDGESVLCGLPSGLTVSLQLTSSGKSIYATEVVVSSESVLQWQIDVQAQPAPLHGNVRI